MENKFFTLPPLPYGYGELAPFLSEEQLTIHHQKHHQAYANGANAVLEKLDQARGEKTAVDVRAFSKELAFQLGGYDLHFLFWKNIAPSNAGGGEPSGQLAQMINEQFGDIARFKAEFTQGAMSVEGAGWMALSFCARTGRLLLMQIEKHNVNLFPSRPILFVLDMFEHAYYIDYKNDKGKYIEAFWNHINWPEIGQRADKAIKGDK
jgi:Fe-Mn family superoxide dismutase